MRDTEPRLAKLIGALSLATDLVQGLPIGTDAAGSVRWPAHCCGITGLKPSPLLLRLGQETQQLAQRSVGDLSGFLARLDVFRMTMLGWFAPYDFILCPVCAR